MKEELSKKTRTESDLIGSREIPETAMYGVQTLRGIENFRISKFHLNEYLRGERNVKGLPGGEISP